MNDKLYYILAICLLISLATIVFNAVIILFNIKDSNVMNDKYGQPLDQDGNFTAFGEKWTCHKTGVQMECELK